MTSCALISALLYHQHLSAPLADLLLPSAVQGVSCSPLCWQEGDEGRLTAAWPLPASVLTGLEEILPCLSAPGARAFRFTLDYTPAGAEPPGSLSLDPVGRWPCGPSDGVAQRESRTADTGEEHGTEQEAVSAEIDLWRVNVPLKRATVRLAVTPACGARQALPGPALVSVSLRRTATVDEPTRRPGVSLPGPSAAAEEASRDGRISSALSQAREPLLIDVPALSQKELDPALAGRVCSPTCLAMVLAYHGCPADIYQVIRDVEHAPTGLYGVWPANIHAAAQRGAMGVLLHFPDFRAARELLERGVPLIASIRFAPGELAGAPIPSSHGHLIVLCGWEGDQVIVNDPAAADAAGVRRRYALSDLEAVWLTRSAVGYVLVPRQALMSDVTG